MNACFITQKDDHYGDENMYRLWRRWGNSAYMSRFFEVQGGWFDKYEPSTRNTWHLDDAKHPDRDTTEAPAQYAHMIRIDLRETEDVVIALLLNELDGI